MPTPAASSGPRWVRWCPDEPSIWVAARAATPLAGRAGVDGHRHRLFQCGGGHGSDLARRRGLRIDWVVADLRNVPLPGCRFDLVIQSFVHLPAPEHRAVLQRASASLRPSGTVLVVGYDVGHLRSGEAADGCRPPLHGRGPSRRPSGDADRTGRAAAGVRGCQRRRHGAVCRRPSSYGPGSPARECSDGEVAVTACGSGAARRTYRPGTLGKRLHRTQLHQIEPGEVSRDGSQVWALVLDRATSSSVPRGWPFLVREGRTPVEREEPISNDHWAPGWPCSRWWPPRAARGGTPTRSEPSTPARTGPATPSW